MPTANGIAEISPGNTIVGWCPRLTALKLAWMLMGRSDVEE